MGKQVMGLLIALVGGIAMASVLVAIVFGTRAAPSTISVPPGPAVPAFGLTDQNGNPVDESILDGRYTVVDFIFTSCPLYCPTMTAEMKRIQDATAGTGLRFLSLSIDGEVDTPERLLAWGEAYGADPDRWVFATGAPASVWAIARTLGFDVSLEDDDITKADGSVAANINHPTRLILVGPDRRVIDMAAYTVPGEVDALIAKARKLAG
ncbi:MAG: SCO family protein [Phycisphaerales bacterium]